MSDGITPEWLIECGAKRVGEWYVFDEGVRLTSHVKGWTHWLIVVNGRMLDWSAETRDQVERLRQALRGEVA